MEELQNNIVIYNPSEDINLEVRVAEDTVWLTQAQMARLFSVKENTITYHIKEIYKIKELQQNATTRKIRVVRNEGQRIVNRQIDFYNLDMILSIGYRVNTVSGIQFRHWATSVLKEFMFKGYVANQRLVAFEQNIENRLVSHERQIRSINQRIDEMVQTAMPPKYGLFFNGQVFDAYVFVVDLIKSATNSIRLADNYVDESVLLMLSKRNETVGATIFTERATPQLQLDLRKHNAQYPPVDIKRIEKVHDRFLLIDGVRLYHFGASFKDLARSYSL